MPQPPRATRPRRCLSSRRTAFPLPAAGCKAGAETRCRVAREQPAGALPTAVLCPSRAAVPGQLSGSCFPGVSSTAPSVPRGQTRAEDHRRGRTLFAGLLDGANKSAFPAARAHALPGVWFPTPGHRSGVLIQLSER